MLIRTVALLTLLVWGSGLLAQGELPSTDAEIEAEYQRRIKKEYLNRVYIHKDLAD